MNYAYQYFKIISNRVQHPLTRNDCYVEKHHIIPKSEGGSDYNDNLVNLTAREHYIAHILLAKIYDDKKMWCAVNRLIHGNDFMKYNHISSRMYEYLKKNIFSTQHTPMFGNHHSELTKEKIRKGMLGKSNALGFKQSDEAKKKISESRNRKKGNYSLEEKRKMSESMKKYWIDHRDEILSKRTKWRENIGTHWYNNGNTNIRAKECPEGFVAGILRKTHNN